MSEHNLTLSDLDSLDIDDFDSSEYLSSEQAIAAYLTEALESNDASMLAAAVGNVARARGMAEIAKASGLAREGLYKALRPNSQPRMETIIRVLGALGVRLVAEAIAPVEKTIEPVFASNQKSKGGALAEKPVRLANAKTIGKTMAKSAIPKPTAKPTAAKPAPKRPAPRLATKRPTA